MLLKTRFRFIAMAILAALAVTLAVALPGVSADGGEGKNGDQSQAPPIPDKTALNYPNLGSHLDQLVSSVEAGQATSQDAAGETSVHSGETVAVTIYLTGNVDAVVSFLEDNGGDPRNVGEDYIEAYVPVTLLGPVSEQPGVIRVREIIPPQPSYGPATSQGVQTHLAQAWHDAGYTGQGVKVGIIDVGYEGFRGLVGQELPSSPAGVRCYTDIGVSSDELSDCEIDGVHGNASTETVIDIAPTVSLYLTNPRFHADMRDAVDSMISEDVSVINASISWWFDGPGDGTSPYTTGLANTVDRAVDAGIVWVNSAGNSAPHTWFGDYSNPDGDEWVDFGEAGERNYLNIPPGDSPFQYLRIDFRWEDNWVLRDGELGGATSDLDIFVIHGATGQVLASSQDRQTGEPGDFPVEFLEPDHFNFTPTGDDYYVAVRHVSGDAPEWIQIQIDHFGPTFQNPTLHGSIKNPGDSKNLGMLTVGAAHYWDTHTIADYSSRGPTPDGRVKPDIVGTACAETAAYEPHLLEGNDCWYAGTSASSPHVAGLAALVRQRFPDYTPVQVPDYLKDNAAQRETPDPNNTWGHGFAQLPSISSVTPLPVVVFADLNWPSARLQNHIARYIVENGYGHPTSLASGSSLPLLQGLRDGEVHVMMEVWLPSQIEAWEEALAAGDVLSPGASLGNDWQSAFVIPAYLQEQYPELDSVEDLKEQQYQALFATAETSGKARLVSCVIGWNCAEINDDQIEAYGLSEHVHIVNPDSVAVLNAYLYDAYEKRVPWLGYQWGTSTPALLLDLVRLEEPEYSDECWRTTRACGYEEDTILIGVNSGLSEQAPQVVELLEQWDFNVDVHLRNVVRWQDANPDASIEDASFYWLSNNVDIWSGWVTDEAAIDILAALDKDALVALYHATGGANWTNNTNWLTTAPIGQWYGVTTDGNGRVTNLVLNDNQLSGTIPTQLGNLANTEELILTRNQLTGTIPAELASLTELEILALGGNQLTGTIPTWLGNLANLEELHLWENELTGTIPPELGNLTNLELLSLSSNQLTGIIPAELGSLANLTELYLGDNELSGKIRSELGTLANLKELWLSENRLTGEIPPELGDLLKLKSLALSFNRLSGEIPADLGSLTNLSGLHLGSNQLTGKIPPELGNLVDLEFLGLRNNGLTGKIPPKLGSLTSLEELGLSDNHLSGEIPPELGNLTSLGNILFGRNQLTGEIPPELGNLLNLHSLYLYENEFTGEIPPELGNLTNLTILRLDGNQLTGEIPEELSNLRNLIHLYLFDNELTGGILPELGNLTDLETLLLYGNQFTGEIPSELGRLSNLNRLDLGGNQLRGEIPSELGSLSKLELLSLSSNQLSGNIPEELGNLANLEELYLWGNQLSGTVPQSLAGLTMLESFVFHHNPGLCAPVDDAFQTWLGSIPTVFGSSCAPADSPEDRAVLVQVHSTTDGANWTNNANWLSEEHLIREWYGVTNDANGQVRGLFLDDNQLTGKIPSELGGLTKLEWLYLNDNQLTGEIPAELGDLANLRVLSLTDNQLTGEIPVELGQLTNLTVLHLAGNQLTGCVPDGLRDVAVNDFPQLGLPFCQPYDANGDGAIDIGELFTAIDDYFAGVISIGELFTIIDLYFSGPG